MSKPLDLKHYFADSRRNLPVKRGELAEILAHFVTKDTVADALGDMHHQIMNAIKNEVQEELGAFMVSLQTGEKTEESGIITLSK